MKIQKDKKYKQYNDQQDYSQDQYYSTRRLLIKPLNLNKQQLQKRLQTLKDYNTWKSTKPLRINFNQIDSTTKDPIINAAVCYGSKNGFNEVLSQFVQSYQQQQVNQTDNYKIENFNISKEKINGNQTQEKPSFLKYKKSYAQIHKINKMVTPKLSLKSHNQQTPKRAKTQPNRQSNKQGYYNQPFPKELKTLKNKLRRYTSILHQSKISQFNIQMKEIQPIATIDSNENKISINELNLQSNIENNQINSCFSGQKNIRNRRRQYIQEISRILNRSLFYLQGITQKDEIRVSNQSIYSSEPTHYPNIDQTISHQNIPSPLISHQKRHVYWPIHYNNIEQNYFHQMQQIAKTYNDRIQNELDIHQQQKEILKIIKQNFKQQEKELNKQVLNQQKQSFSKKFDYKIGLQRQNYKRNIKQFLRCKKQYYLQRQRQQIRANGIKRIKKISQVTNSKGKEKIQSQQEQIINEI